MKKKEKIPPSRIIAYTILGSLLCVVASFFWMTSTISDAENAKRELLSLREQLLEKQKEQEPNLQVINKYKGKDPLFLHKKLESYELLSDEIAKLKVKVAKSALPEDLVLEKRLNTITSGDNIFSFVENSTEVGKIYKEVIERQTRPVEVDTTNLFSILDILEGAQDADSRPDLIISDALIEKHKGVIQETWNLSFLIVRREYTP